MFDAAGNMLPIRDWPDDIAAAIASIEPEAVEIGKGKSRTTVLGYRVRFWDKNSSLEKLFKFGRLYAEAPPPDAGTTNILNVSIDGLEPEERAKIRTSPTSQRPEHRLTRYSARWTRRRARKVSPSTSSCSGPSLSPARRWFGAGLWTCCATI